MQRLFAVVSFEKEPLLGFIPPGITVFRKMRSLQGGLASQTEITQWGYACLRGLCLGKDLVVRMV